ncbi:MAG: bifunctional diaminohydroxyphosphoribosylaminopyrimidine deaminase/5-amino-6-(5-phosphoribosylamino)uracil reductase RibD [Planctomycetes bacterium]|nr:bifunctional diaminohydroxyphosphoribosylaminopyrimidine deaminase/5-amino-6-(5-phosphoribosylamino)uracil reductase RibD [Planctomycetota bacterium]
MTHERYMRLALELAIKGEWYVAPNPQVGAVVVKNNRIIGRGYHQYFGGPHAEINAINSINNPEHLNGATLYLTLEPCSHFGKTPPCAEAIVSSGIKKVVIATRDPNPLVRGRGIALLKKHGVTIIEGVLAKVAQAINRPFFKTQEKGLPYVIAKWAMSQDGKMALPKGQGRWITSKKSRDYAKSIRAQCQAVMVGINTVLKDKPRLLARVGYLMNPARIILDSHARLPLDSKIIKTIDQGDVYLMVSPAAPKIKRAKLEKKGVKVLTVPARKGRLDFMAAMRTLARNGINKLMIEGGPSVLKSAFDNKVVDEVYCFISPRIIGGSKTISARGFFKIDGAIRLNNSGVKYIRPDLLIHGYV